MKKHTVQGATAPKPGTENSGFLIPVGAPSSDATSISSDLDLLS